MVDIHSTFQLNDGTTIPRFGLGLYQTPEGKTTRDAIQWAYDTGYRLFDTAQIYGNEASVGEALQELDADRSDLYITTKLWRDNVGKDVKPSLHKSLDKLQLDHIDLVLMHWPIKDHRLDNWDQMIELRDEGLTTSIGVSNFTQKHLEELLDHSDVIPAVNQMEASVFLQNPSLVTFCKEHDIVYESYSPLTKARRLDDPRIVKMSEKYHKTPAQIMIHWVIDNEIIVIPKSVHKKRIEENADVFDFSLSDEDLEEMSHWDEHLVTGWNPYTYD